MTLSWPIATLRPGKLTRHLTARTTAGTVSALGFTQRVSLPAHSWMLKFENILLSRASEIRAWDAIKAQLDGGANSILVPLVEQDRLLPATDFSDTSMFDDGSGFTDLGGLLATTVGAADAGATALTIHFTQNLPGPLPGHHFSIGERLYVIATAAAPVADNYAITIRPPLREDVLSGATVDFGNLVCKCRLATDDEMMLTLDPTGMGTGTVNFIEDPR